MLCISTMGCVEEDGGCEEGTSLSKSPIGIVLKSVSAVFAFIAPSLIFIARTSPGFTCNITNGMYNMLPQISIHVDVFI